MSQITLTITWFT